MVWLKLTDERFDDGTDHHLSSVVSQSGSSKYPLWGKMNRLFNGVWINATKIESFYICQNISRL